MIQKKSYGTAIIIQLLDVTDKMVIVYIAVMLSVCFSLGHTSALHYSYGCSEPQAPLYGGYSPKQYFYYVGSTISFHCDDGYEMDGASWTVCIYDAKVGKGAWIHSPPICTRKFNTYNMAIPVLHNTYIYSCKNG